MTNVLINKRQKERNWPVKGLTGKDTSAIIITTKALPPQQASGKRGRAQEPWCSGLTCLPVTQKIAGSNPVGSGRTSVLLPTDSGLVELLDPV